MLKVVLKRYDNNFNNYLLLAFISKSAQILLSVD